MIIMRRVGSNAAGESPKLLRIFANSEAAACACGDMLSAPGTRERTSASRARAHLQQLSTSLLRLQLGAGSLAQRHAAPLVRQSMPGEAQVEAAQSRCRAAGLCPP